LRQTLPGYDARGALALAPPPEAVFDFLSALLAPACLPPCLPALRKVFHILGKIRDSRDRGNQVNPLALVKQRIKDILEP